MKKIGLADLLILGGGNVSSASRRRTGSPRPGACQLAISAVLTPLFSEIRGNQRHDDVPRCTAHVPPFLTTSRMARDQLFSKRLDMADQA